MNIRIGLVIVVLTKLCLAVPPQEYFLQGNKYFYDGDFAQARVCYEKIPAKSCSVWQNLGNCYYNEQNLVKALACWKRAQRGASYTQLGQLFETERLILEKFNCPCDGIFIRGVKRTILALPMLLLYSLLVSLLVLFILLFYQCIIKRRLSYKMLSCKNRYLCLLILGVVVLLLLIAAKEKFTKEKQGVLTHQKVVVYAGPETSFHQKSVLPQGHLVQVVDEYPGMCKIVHPSSSGWITSDSIEIV